VSASSGPKAAVKRLAGAIQKRRVDLRLTQEDVAYAAGLSVRHYQQLESGDANPRFDTLFHLARVLKWPLATMMQGVDIRR
jgi:transcriptional regulator with XRE-family HTH domain